MTEKIIRTICKFSRTPLMEDVEYLRQLKETLESADFSVQTLRLCSTDSDAVFELDAAGDGSMFLSIGRLTLSQVPGIFERFLAAKNVAFNLDLSDKAITDEHTGILFEIIRRNAAKTFSFTFTFNVPALSPYYPSATMDPEHDGFAVGLQSTNLSAGRGSIDEWLTRMEQAWVEIIDTIGPETGFFGIDTSVAPLYEGPGSLLQIVKNQGLSFDEAVTSEVFMKISSFIQTRGPKNTGLCGLFFPCLEDFELAAEYEAGNFPIERNLFLSLHSGLGIDSYPIGIDERPARVTQILRLVQRLSNRYRKPLSVRFISDGRARIGDHSRFENPYLKDVVIRAL